MPDSIRTIAGTRSEAARELVETSETPALDAELLLREALGVSRSELFLREPEPLPADAAERFRYLVQRRLAGEPVAYILGRKGFRTIELMIDERVLVPRPETEDLVERALGWLWNHPGPKRVVDVGTGSGAIALSLAVETSDRPEIEIVATDVSAGALDVASINRSRLKLDGRVELVRAHLLDGLSGPFDLILANLPYLRDDQRHPSTEREPLEALFAGADGFDLYRELFRQVPDVLAPDGAMIAEIDPSQAGFGGGFAARVTGLPVEIARDSSGRDRFLIVGSRA